MRYIFMDFSLLFSINRKKEHSQNTSHQFRQLLVNHQPVMNVIMSNAQLKNTSKSHRKLFVQK